MTKLIQNTVTLQHYSKLNNEQRSLKHFVFFLLAVGTLAASALRGSSAIADSISVGNEKLLENMNNRSLRSKESPRLDTNFDENSTVRRRAETLSMTDTSDVVSGMARLKSTATSSKGNQSALKTLQQLALERIEELQRQEQSLDLSDLKRRKQGLTPVLVENIVEVRRFRLSQRLNNQTHAQLHLFSHIPKTGGAYLSRLLNKLVMGDLQYYSLVNVAEDRFRPCDIGSFKEEEKCPGETRGTVCTGWLSEREVPMDENEFKYLYTMIRNPHEHVISQYFHCKESLEHSNSEAMPTTLTEWLSAWVAKIDGEENESNASILHGDVSHFQCYDPRNMQSALTGFDQFANIDGPATFDREGAKRVLREKFAVLGDMARATETACLTAIKFAGFVPAACNCSSVAKRTSQTLPYIRPVSDLENNHGVQHHGATYHATPEETAMIHRLTRKDQRLYELVKEVFEEQLAATEAEYGIQICSEKASQLKLGKREVVACDTGSNPTGRT